MLDFSFNQKGALPEDLWGETSAFRAQPAGIPAAGLSGSLAGVSAKRFWHFPDSSFGVQSTDFAKRRISGSSVLSNSEKSRCGSPQSPAGLRRFHRGKISAASC